MSDILIRLVAATMAENAPHSIAGAKLMLHALVSGEADRRQTAITSAQRRAMGSRDYRKGIGAFLEKRSPGFTGERKEKS